MPLVNWIEEPRADRGLYFFDNGRWQPVSYPELASLVWSAATRLQEAGVEPGDVVGLAVPTGPAFAAGFYGAWAVGATAAPIPASPLGQPAAEYLDRLAAILELTRPSAIVVDPRSREFLATASSRLCDEQPLALVEFTPARCDRVAQRPVGVPDRAVVQFTSGSTGSPRRVELSRQNLTANVDAIKSWLEIGPGDATATWLPLYHDMGLIGCFLTPVAAQSDVYLMRPEQLIRYPTNWLACFGDGRATMTAVPNSALKLLLRMRDAGRIDLRRCEADFASWKALIVGAERVDAATMEEFCDWLSPWGFTSDALLPAYGLAEATLAVTGHSLRSSPSCIRLANKAFEFGMPVDVVERRILDGSAELVRDQDWFVACGPPLGGVEVDVVDRRGSALPEGSFGEITIRGPSVARSVHGTVGMDGRASAEAGVLRTGDVGFLHHGELIVVGRDDDRLDLGRGQLHPESLEALLTRLPNAPLGRFACVAAPSDRGLVVLVAEDAQPSWLSLARSTLQQHLGSQARIAVVAGERGAILRTTSGKPRRREIAGGIRSEDVT